MSIKSIKLYLAFGAGAALLALAACSRPNPVPATVAATPSLAAASPGELATTPTPLPPSPTPEPLAAIVNGAGITLAEYQEELRRYQAVVGIELATEDQQRVLDDLIDTALLAQAAGEEGFQVDEALVQERLHRLAAELGGQPALADWMANNGYTEASFLSALARSIAAAWMRDRIAGQFPQTAEQVHARQILVTDAAQANELYAQLQAGSDFAALAAQFNTLTGGDLGWFPRGYIPELALEEAAFSLEAGQYSQVVETLSGFHILQVIERDPQRTLSPDARRALQAQAVQQWLEQQRSQGDIQVLLP